LNGYQKKSLRVSAGVLSTAVLGSALLFSGVPRVQADDDQAKCQHRIEKAEARLDDAVRHHGERSPEAESRRRDLTRSASAAGMPITAIGAVRTTAGTASATGTMITIMTIITRD